MARPDVVELFARVQDRWDRPVVSRRRRRLVVLHPDYLVGDNNITGKRKTYPTPEEIRTAIAAHKRAEQERAEQRGAAERARLAKRAADRARWAENARRREAEAPQRRLAQFQKRHPDLTPEQIVEYVARVDRERVEARERAQKQWEERQAKHLAREEAQRADQIRRRAIAYRIGYDKNGYIAVELVCTWCGWVGNLREPYTDGLPLTCGGCGMSVTLARARVTDALTLFFLAWD